MINNNNNNYFQSGLNFFTDLLIHFVSEFFLKQIIYVLLTALENEEELSPEEEKMRLGKLVDKSDTNNDKFLTRYELLQWFIRKSA